MSSVAGETTDVVSTTMSEGGATHTPTAGLTSAMSVALPVVILAGAALRLWQYAGNASLWTDEIALAKGILTLDIRNLLTDPLPYNQVAPVGFLLVQKLAVMALGPNDYALRLFPLICSLTSLVVFWRLAVRVVDGVAPLAAVTLFATAVPFIAYGALVKQYSTDVCVAIIIWWLAHWLTSRPATPWRANCAALLGSMLVWFSHTGVLMLVALAAVAVLTPAREVPRRTLVPTLACWGASSLAVVLATLAKMTADTRELMYRFWTPGFAPLSLERFLETYWPLDRLRALFGPGQAYDGLAYPLPLMYVVLTAAGFAMLWRRNRRAAMLLTAPLVMTLGAAVLRQYPFIDRLILFLLPSFMLAIAVAIEGVRRLLWPFSRSLGAVAVVGLLLPAVYPVAATPPVYYTEHMKPVLSFVRDRRQPGDDIYVYYGAAPAVTFYEPQYGLSRDQYLIGGCHRGDSRRYLRELDTLRGRARVWVLLTHAGPRYREREDILAYLDAIGTKRDSIVVESRGVGLNLLPAAAYLYDLSLDSKLAAADADSFPLAGRTVHGQRLGCGEGPQAVTRTDFR